MRLCYGGLLDNKGRKPNYQNQNAKTKSCNYSTLHNTQLTLVNYKFIIIYNVFY